MIFRLNRHKKPSAKMWLSAFPTLHLVGREKVSQSRHSSLFPQKEMILPQMILPLLRSPHNHRFIPPQKMILPQMILPTIPLPPARSTT
jgi:hypothetical protein